MQFLLEANDMKSQIGQGTQAVWAGEEAYLLGALLNRD